MRDFLSHSSVFIVDCIVVYCCLILWFWSHTLRILLPEWKAAVPLGMKFIWFSFLTCGQCCKLLVAGYGDGECEWGVTETRLLFRSENQSSAISFRLWLDFDSETGCVDEADLRHTVRNCVCVFKPQVWVVWGWVRI